MGFGPFLEAGADILGGIAENQSRGMEAKQYERNAALAKIASDQTEVLRREDYAAASSAVNAIRTGRGLDVASPTGMVLQARLSYEASRSILTDRLNSLNTQLGYYTQAGIAKSQGNAAFVGGFLKAGTAIAKGAASAGAAGG